MPPALTRVVYIVRPGPQTQACVWQIYAHVKHTLDSRKEAVAGAEGVDQQPRLVDFKVPRTTYFGVGSYINQVQLTFRTDSEQQRQQLADMLDTPLPEHEKFSFTRREGKPSSSKQQQTPAK